MLKDAGVTHPENCDSKKSPFSGPVVKINKTTVPSLRKKSERNQDRPFKRCIVSFGFLNGIISK